MSWMCLWDSESKCRASIVFAVVLRDAAEFFGTQKGAMDVCEASSQREVVGVTSEVLFALHFDGCLKAVVLSRFWVALVVG